MQLCNLLVLAVSLIVEYSQGQLELGLGQNVSLFYTDLPVSAPTWVSDNGRTKTFWTSATTKINPQCWADIQTYTADLATGKRWALLMADSYGGRTSGWASGNTLSEGHYDQCVGIHAGRTGSNGRPLAGKYCTTHWAYGGDQSFVLVGAGLCVPSSCNHSDIYWIMKNIGPPDSYFAWPYPETEPSSRHSYCEEPKAPVYEERDGLAAVVIMSMIACFALVGSLFDIITSTRRHSARPRDYGVREKAELAPDAHNELPFMTDQTNNQLTRRKGGQVVTSDDGPVHDNVTERKPKPKYIPKTWESVLLSFSVMENAPRMLSFDHPPGSFPCLNGIRFLSMCWIVLGHTCHLGLTITGSLTVENLPRLNEIKSIPNGFVLLNYGVAVESFFILSAMLTTIGFMRQLKSNNDRASCVHFGLYYFHRFWRLTPVYMILLMIWTVFFPHFTGPLFPDDRWRNFLYIQNLYNSKQMDCMGWTWYLANDFQYYVFAPALICLLYWKRKAGVVATITLLISSLLVTIYTAYTVHVSRTTDFLYEYYAVPWCRCTTYILGIFLGYLLQTNNFNVNISKTGLVFVWVGAFLCLPVSMFPAGGGWLYILFEVFQRPVFGIAVCWLIFACLTGYAGHINSILSWRGWLPLSRLTYTGFLIHPMLIFYTYFSSRRQVYVTHWYLAYYSLATLTLTLGLSFVASLLVEMPFLNLEKIMFKNVNRTPHANREYTKRETEDTD